MPEPRITSRPTINFRTNLQHFSEIVCFVAGIRMDLLQYSEKSFLVVLNCFISIAYVGAL